MRVALVAVVLSLLSACGSTPRRPDAVSADLTLQTERERGLERQPQWRVDGRIAVSDGRDGGSGRIHWQQDGARFEIRLEAPVTRRSWRLSGMPGHARLEGLEGGPFDGPDASVLLHEKLGWNVPVDDLAAWVRGMRAAGGSHVELGDDGLPSLIQQRGWNIQYRQFMSAHELMMPRKVFAERGQQRIRLIVDAWSFEP